MKMFCSENVIVRNESREINRARSENGRLSRGNVWDSGIVVFEGHALPASDLVKEALLEDWLSYDGDEPARLYADVSLIVKVAGIPKLAYGGYISDLKPLTIFLRTVKEIQS